MLKIFGGGDMSNGKLSLHSLLEYDFCSFFVPVLHHRLQPELLSICLDGQRSKIKGQKEAKNAYQGRQGRKRSHFKL